MTPADTEALQKGQYELRMQMRELAITLRSLEKSMHRLESALEQSLQRVSDLEHWRSEFRGAWFAFRWIPPVVTGVLVGIAVDLLAKL